MTPHVLGRLPLWVEGDLEAQDQAAIEAHLAQCSSCQMAAAQLQTSQSWLREVLESPFETSDQERLRRTVMEQIRTEAVCPSPRRLATRPALFAASAAALLLATLRWHQTQPLAQPPALEKPPALAPKPADSNPPQPEVTHHAPPQRAPVWAKPSREAHLSMAASAPPREEPARIELQTADPTVRIIWLAQAKPLSDTTPPTQEVP